MFIYVIKKILLQNLKKLSLYKEILIEEFIARQRNTSSNT